MFKVLPFAVAMGLLASPALALDLTSQAPSTNVTVADAAPVAKPAKPRTPKQEAALVRIKACGAEWKAQTDHAGLKWPQFWHVCSDRLKAQAN